MHCCPYHITGSRRRRQHQALVDPNRPTPQNTHSGLLWLRHSSFPRLPRPHTRGPYRGSSNVRPRMGSHELQAIRHGRAVTRQPFQRSLRHPFSNPFTDSRRSVEILLKGGPRILRSWKTTGNWPTSTSWRPTWACRSRPFMRGGTDARAHRRYGWSATSATGGLTSIGG